MIRVLAVSPSRDVMGAEQSLLNISPFLAAHGVQIELAAPGGGEFEKRWRGQGLEFRRFDVAPRRGIRSTDGTRFHGVAELLRLTGRTARAITRLVRVVRASRPDVIHSNLLLTHVDCAVVGRLTRTRSVLEFHEIVAPGPGRWLLGAAILVSSGAVAVSTASRDQVPRWARRKVAVIPQCVDIRRFDSCAPVSEWRRKLTTSPESPLVAAVGRIDPEKGLDVLIDAVVRVREDGLPLQLTLVGSPGTDDGSHLSDLVSRAEPLLGDAFRVVPQVDDVAGVLGAIDVLACPSFEEPFGMILLEAQWCRRPVIACRSGGPGEFIDDGETGLLVSPHDAGELADALTRLFDDPQLRRRLAEAGAERVRDHYVAPVRAGRFASLYRRLAGVRT